MSVQQVDSFRWTCEECCDSGLADTEMDAWDLLGEHEDEAHREPDDAGREEPDDVWGGGGAMKCPECGRFLARPWSENSGYPDYDVSWGGICKVHGEVSE